MTAMVSTSPGTASLPIQPAYLSWGDPVTDPPASLGLMTFDAILSEQHERAAIVTDHAVEQGTNVVDNVRPLPDRLTLETFVSNVPINSPDAKRFPLTLDLPQPGQNSFLAGGVSNLLSQAAVALGIINARPVTVSVSVDQFFGETNYVAITYSQLTSLRDLAVLVTVITPNASYYNMIIENIKLHRDSSTGTSGYFTLEFREVRIISSSVGDAPLPTIPRGNHTVAQGTKNPAVADDAPKDGLLKHLANSMGTAVAGSGTTAPLPGF